MASQKIDDLIGNLSEELEPQKPYAHPLLAVAPWFLGCIVYMAGIVLYLGVRHDVHEKHHDITFTVDALLVAVMAVFAALGSAFLRFPDARGQKWILYVAPLLFAGFLIWKGSFAIHENIMPDDLVWYSCIDSSLLMGIIPIAAFAFFSGSGATTRPILMAFMNSLAIFGVGYVAMRLSCAADQLAHDIAYHLVPFIVLGLAVGLLARKLYRW